MAVAQMSDKEVRGFLREMPPDFAECRDLGHNWEYSGVYVEREVGRQIREMSRRVVCQRCDCLRVDRIGFPGAVRLGSTYFYPKGYRKEGTGRIWPATVREEIMPMLVKMAWPARD